MANLRRELWRHDWQQQYLYNPSCPQRNDKGLAPDLLCISCRKPWCEHGQGSPPVDGCPVGVKARNMGRARMADTDEYLKVMERA